MPSSWRLPGCFSRDSEWRPAAVKLTSPHAYVELVTRTEVYPDRGELADRHVWRCTCGDAGVSCHEVGAWVVLRGGEVVISDGILPMGPLANQDLRAARIETYRLFNSLRQPPACMSRPEAYVWSARLLEGPTDEAHIASLSYDDAAKVELAIEDLARPPDQPPELPGAAHWLTQAGIELIVEPDGRLVVQAGREVIDCWLDRQSWQVRGWLIGEHGGFYGLILYCR